MNKYHIALALIMLVFVGFSLYSLNDMLSDAGDNAQYIILSKALVSMKGFREINNPFLPAHTKSPPVFPFILAPFTGIFGYNIIILKLVMLAITLVLFVYLYLMFKEYVPEYLALALTTASMFTYEMFNWTTDIMTEIPFLLFMVMSIYYYKKEYFWPMCLSVILATLTKSTGVVLIPAIGLALLLRKEYKAAIKFGAICIIPFILWSGVNMWIHPGSESYFSTAFLKDGYSPEGGYMTIQNMVDRITRLAVFYMQEIVMLFLTYRPILSAAPWSVLIICGLIFAGMVRLAVKKDPLPFVILFVLMLQLIWPWATIRFVLPLAPLMLCAVAFALISIYEIFSSNSKTVNMLLFITLCVLIIAEFPAFVDKTEQLHTNRYEDQSVQKLYLMSDYVKNNLPANATVMVRTPYLFHIWSGHLTGTYPYVTDQQRVFDSAVSYDYVIVDEYSGTTKLYLMPVISQYPEIFVEKFSIVDTKIYEVSEQAKEVYRK